MVNFSSYQKEIFKFVDEGSGNGVVNAFAGSGKTTTGVEAIRSFSPVESGYFMSFSRRIADELSKRLVDVPNVESSTYNSFGWRILLKHKRMRLDKWKTWNHLKNIVGDKEYYKWRVTIGRVIDIAKNKAIMDCDELQHELYNLSATYDIDLPEKDHAAFVMALMATFKACYEDTKTADFNDQKFLVIKMGLEIPQSDFLLVDEYQDTCEIETRLVLGACVHGRKIAIGDPNQSIYSFKGTTPDSMAIFKEQFNAFEMSLPICYRCSKNVIREAQKIVPTIMWHDGAIEGGVEHIKLDAFRSKVGPEDFVLSRVTLSLVKSVLSFLRENRRAYIVGNEIGDMLVALVNRIADGESNIAIFDAKLVEHYDEKMEKLEALDRQEEMIQLTDKFETIRLLVPDSDNVFHLCKRIKNLFEDKTDAIKHLTIHKAKGLEARDVYLLDPQLLPHPRSKNIDEELRLKYVAITRAERVFHYVN